MDTTVHIRTLAGMTLILFIASVSASLYLESSLHPLLQEYLQLENEWDLSRTEDLFLMFAIPIAMANIAAVIGLIFIKNWAVNVFIITSIVLMIFNFITGPVVDDAISSSLGGISCMANGIILYLLIYSNSAFSNSDGSQYLMRASGSRSNVRYLMNENISSADPIMAFLPLIILSILWGG